MSKKKAPAKKRAAPDRPVTVMAPDYVTACSVPYEVRVVDLPESTYGTTTELSDVKIVRYRETFASPMDLLLTIAHEALETAEFENMCKFQSHEELDRAAHVVAEHFLAWVMAQ